MIHFQFFGRLQNKLWEEYDSLDHPPQLERSLPVISIPNNSILEYMDLRERNQRQFNNWLSKTYRAQVKRSQDRLVLKFKNPKDELLFRLKYAEYI